MPSDWINIDCSLNILMQKNPLFQMFLKRNSKIVFYPNPRNCIYMRLDHKWNFSDKSVDVVYSSHTLEHLNRAGVHRFMRESFRVLKPGGVLRLVVPDLFKIAKDYIHAHEAGNENAATIMQERLNLHLEGAYPPERRTIVRLLAWFQGYPLQHKIMYDALSLRRLIANTGFVQCRESSYGISKYLSNIQDVEYTKEGVPSIYFEAIKPSERGV